jgi:hypothetical protein
MDSGDGVPGDAELDARAFTFALEARRFVLMSVCGGDKSSQAADIKRAKDLWVEWKRRQS